MKACLRAGIQNSVAGRSEKLRGIDARRHIGESRLIEFHHLTAMVWGGRDE